MPGPTRGEMMTVMAAKPSITALAGNDERSTGRANRSMEHPAADNSCQPRSANPASGAAPGRYQIGLYDREFTLFQVSGLLMSAMEQSVSFEGLRREIDIDLQQGSWPAATVSYAEMRRIFERLWLTGDKAQSLFNHASRINFASFGIVSLAAMALDSSEKGIRFCAKNLRTPWNAVPEANRNGSMSMLHIPKFYDPELRATLEHFHFVNCFAVSRSRSPGIRVADSVRFTRSCGISRSALEDYFGCPVFFDEDIAQIDFSRQWLDRPVPILDPGLRTRVTQMFEDVLAEEALRGQSILQFLSTHLDEIRSSEDMARLLGVSRRTLARLLDREGVSYSILSREVRLTAARRMLRHGVGTARIAENLGFADERSFRRAFRTWSGVSPSEYRRSQERFPGGLTRA
ncbi:AraC family transcriptional regulator [Pseudothauera nasutitermitis]|uniref:AraC family transcriptional regulator n=1 Tax=Pseudothauera nasutitermitis TaxID=2565930 RepID=A0A4S4ASG1_9RHOO|nr:AraC family transcriptional regulator [Pseudothauera nasutitermitis]THF62793.1 AraC family transcriptional regulator [Pseudothauera nasutitermitis]